MTVFVFITFAPFSSWAKKEGSGIFAIGYYGKPNPIDPLQTNSGIGGHLIDIIYDSLLDMTSDGELKPRLAKRWEVSPDGRQWTFHLNDNIFFHDTHKLTTEDVKFTYEEIIRRRNSAYYNMLRYLDKIEIADNLTIIFKLKKNDNTFPVALFYIGIAPKHLYKKSSSPAPIGSGPFTLVQQSEKEITLKANKNYFQGRPYLDEIIVKFFPTQRANLSALMSGEVDMLYLQNDRDYGLLKSVKRIKTYNPMYKMGYMLSLNNQHNNFKDTRIRKALQHAIDKEYLVKKILRGEGSVISSLTPSSNRHINHNIKSYIYSPKLAVELLNKAGWMDTDNDFILDKDGVPLKFTLLVIRENELDRNIARVIEQQLKEIGIDMGIKMVNLNELATRLYHQRNFEAAFFPFNLRYDLFINYTLWHSSQIGEGYNFSSYKNPSVDQYLDSARTEIDSEKQRKAYIEFQKVIHDDPPGVFLFWRNFTIAIDKRFRGIPDSPFEFFKNLPNVWVPKNEQKHKTGNLH